MTFDEAVRRQSPVQTFFRTTTTDVDIAGIRIPEGGKILMFLGSADRDPERRPDPDRFDLTRDPSGHVGFGMGIHQCVGHHVARLEAECLLTALARRVEHLELAGEPRRHLDNTLRSWAALPVRVRPARRPPGPANRPKNARSPWRTRGGPRRAAGSAVPPGKLERPERDCDLPGRT
ncbi:cytochrome P450 [Streptomyces mexicanus]|uniref:cytochrome P450 n=1 Tax=Streptomyces mexicanus TaxID=178566 RepID=UPI003656F801